MAVFFLLHVLMCILHLMLYGACCRDVACYIARYVFTIISEDSVGSIVSVGTGTVEAL